MLLKVKSGIIKIKSEGQYSLLWVKIVIFGKFYEKYTKKLYTISDIMFRNLEQRS